MAEPIMQRVGPAEEPERLSTPSTPRPVQGRGGDRPRPRRRGTGLRTKILFFLLATLAVLAVVSGVISAFTLQQRMTAEFQSKGEAIARGLSSSAVDLLLNRDASTIQSLVDQYASIEGVAYVMVYNPEQELVAHTFSPFVPKGVVEQNLVPGEESSRNAAVTYQDPATDAERDILDIGVPILAGQLGTVRVGMDNDLITAAAQSSALVLIGLIGLLALVAGLLGWYFATRITRPLNHLAAVAVKVGEGDLSQTAPVESNDEVGLLAHTFNDSISRLRQMISDEESKRLEEQETRESLQRDIRNFLDVSMEMAKGDLTRRGQVTEGVLGNVVDSINLVVEELGDILSGVRNTSEAVNAGAEEMIGSTDRLVQDTDTQLEEARRASSEVAEVTRSAREVSGNAEQTSSAARAAREAAQKGQTAVNDTLEGMQRIRGEVQGISKRIKGLGDRSLEISEIVDTISSISSQTNLLALNAAIEASGAGGEGSRFAVVADEVRKLAEETSRATKRVSALVQSVQGEIHEAVGAMEDGSREVEAGFRVAQEAGARLREIQEIAERSAAFAQSISDSSREQVSGVERVASGVTSIAEISNRTAESVRRGRQTAEQLKSLASTLSERLARFKLAS